MKAVAVAGVPLAPRAPLLLSLSPVCQRSSLFAAPGRCSLKAGAKVRTLSARTKLFGNFFRKRAKFFGIVDRWEGKNIIILSGGIGQIGLIRQIRLIRLIRQIGPIGLMGLGGLEA